MAGHASDRSCECCGATEGKLRRCGRCRNVHYCSQECQKSDWKGHKGKCYVKNPSSKLPVAALLAAAGSATPTAVNAESDAPVVPPPTAMGLAVLNRVVPEDEAAEHMQTLKGWMLAGDSAAGLALCEQLRDPWLAFMYAAMHCDSSVCEKMWACDGRVAAFRLSLSLQETAIATHQLATALVEHPKRTAKNLNAAERAFRRAVVLEPSFDMTHIGLGEFLQHERGDVDGAIDVYVAATATAMHQARPNAQFCQRLGALLMDVRRDVLGAERCYRLVIRADPLHATAHFCLACILLDSKNDMTNAEPALLKALELHDLSTAPGKKDHEKYLDGVSLPAGVELYCTQANTQGDQCVDARLHPNHLGSLLSKLGFIYERKGNPVSGMHYSERALEVDPSNTMALAALGGAKCNAGDFDGAAHNFREIIRIELARTNSHRADGMPNPQALQAKQQASKAYNRLGNALVQKGDLRAAHEATLRALELIPGDPASAHNAKEILAMINRSGSTMTLNVEVNNGPSYS
jgi:tetratricopeptide (TPR) repeat protein